MSESRFVTGSAVVSSASASIRGDGERQVTVLGVGIQLMTSRQVLDTIVAYMLDGRPHSIFIVNAATANLAFENPHYRDCLNRGHLVLNDGTGIRWAARVEGIRLRHNHVGTDLIPALCAECEAWPLRVFVFGGRPGAVEHATTTLSRRFPRLQVVGFHHGYTRPEQDEAVCGMINAARPHLLLVAMGNPLQELWIDRNLSCLERVVAVGVGGLIDHLSGDLHRAPLWMRKAGIEWVHILGQQPHKWRRYVLGNPLFLYRIANGYLRARVR